MSLIPPPLTEDCITTRTPHPPVALFRSRISFDAVDAHIKTIGKTYFQHGAWREQLLLVSRAVGGINRVKPTRFVYSLCTRLLSANESSIIATEFRHQHETFASYEQQEGFKISLDLTHLIQIVEVRTRLSDYVAFFR